MLGVNDEQKHVRNCAVSVDVNEYPFIAISAHWLVTMISLFRIYGFDCSMSDMNCLPLSISCDCIDQFYAQRLTNVNPRDGKMNTFTLVLVVVGVMVASLMGETLA
jgi:hypothetical protein